MVKKLIFIEIKKCINPKIIFAEYNGWASPSNTVK